MNFSWAMSLDPQGANSVIKESRYIRDTEDLDMSDNQIGEGDFDMTDQTEEEQTEDNDEINSTGGSSL